MKKVKAFVLFVLSILVCLMSGCNKYTDRIGVEGYLINKYGQSFQIISVVDKEQTEKNVVFEYNVSPGKYPEIVFRAGQEKVDNTFPFAPPIKEKVYFDNYFEKTKEYLAEKYKQEFVVDDYDDIEGCSSQIFEMMHLINEELSERGFDVTKYTPSVSLEVTVNGSLTEIDFYVMEKSVIYDLIVDAYECTNNLFLCGLLYMP